jgi:hypothetical protein
MGRGEGWGEWRGRADVLWLALAGFGWLGQTPPCVQQRNAWRFRLASERVVLCSSACISLGWALCWGWRSCLFRLRALPAGDGPAAAGLWTAQHGARDGAVGRWGCACAAGATRGGLLVSWSPGLWCCRRGDYGDRVHARLLRTPPNSAVSAASCDRPVPTLGSPGPSRRRCCSVTTGASFWGTGQSPPQRMGAGSPSGSRPSDTAMRRPAPAACAASCPRCHLDLAAAGAVGSPSFGAGHAPYFTT